MIFLKMYNYSTCGIKDIISCENKYQNVYNIQGQIISIKTCSVLYIHKEKWHKTHFAEVLATHHSLDIVQQLQPLLFIIVLCYYPTSSKNKGEE